MKVFCLRLMLSGSPLYALTKDKPLPVPEVDVLIASQHLGRLRELAKSMCL